VAAVGPGVEPLPDPREVAAALWVPVDALRAEEAAAEVLYERDGASFAFPSFRYLGYDVWGRTPRILSGFFELLG
jgi:hypothetical protein